MNPEFERKYHEFEDRYWWFCARRSCIVRLIERQLRIPTSAQILEVGCSAGPLLQVLTQRGYQHLFGLDLSPIAIDLCRQRGLANVQVMDAVNPGFQDQQFDLIIASDVLEHLEHAEQALANWSRVLRSGGHLLVFVPAFMFLWSGHDTANRHFRRYTAGTLKGALKNAGFKIRSTSYWNAALFLPVAAIRLASRVLPRRSGQGDQLVAFNPVINSALRGLVELENRLLGAGLRLPVGISVMAWAQKV